MRPAVLMGGVFAVTLLAQWWFMRPLIPSDQVVYFQAAAAFPDVEPLHKELRLGLILPVRALIEAFGYTQIAYYTVPFLATATFATATTYLGMRLFGRAVGVAAGLLCVLNTYVLLETTTLLPDTLAAALLTTALGLLVRTGERHRGGELRGGDSVALVAAGLLLGWSYLVREFTVFLFPLVPLLLWHYRLPIRCWVMVAASASALFAGELTVNAAMHGDPFVRIAVLSGSADQSQSVVTPEVGGAFQHENALVVIGRLPEALLSDPHGLPLLIALLLGTVVLRSRSLVFLTIWFALLWVPLTLLLGGILDKIRYWYPIFPPLFIGGLAVLSMATVKLVPWRGRAVDSLRLAVLAGVAAFVLTLSGIHNLSLSATYRATGATHLSELNSWLEEEGSDVSTIWTDRRTRHLLEITTQRTFGEGWKGEFRTLSRTALPAPPPPGERTAVVEYDRGLYYGPCASCREVFESALGSPPRIPSNWTLATESGDGTLRVYIVQ